MLKTWITFTLFWKDIKTAKKCKVIIFTHIVFHIDKLIIRFILYIAYTRHMQNHVENVDKLYKPSVSFHVCQEFFDNFRLK